MLTWLYPIKTGRTFFDVWSIFHIAFWLYAGSNFWAFKVQKPLALAIGLFMAFGWEVFEREAESRWPHIWSHPESFINSYISDPLTCVIGIFVAWYMLDNWRF